MKDGEPLRVCVERYGFLPVDKAAFKGEIPVIPGMMPYEPFDFYIKRRLYAHNTVRPYLNFCSTSQICCIALLTPH